ncbi:MAG: UPF0175 family protein [Chloroflexi bacterium]|nr:UPF0175 family protein [Chloroflexota bacterium]
MTTDTLKISPVTIPVMLTSEDAQILRHISLTDHIPEDVLIRKFVLDGLTEYRIEFACRAYAKGRLNLSGASRIAGLGVEEFMGHLKRRGIEYGPSFEQVLDGLETLAEDFDNDILRQVAREMRAGQAEGGSTAAEVVSAQAVTTTE